MLTALAIFQGRMPKRDSASFASSQRESAKWQRQLWWTNTPSLEMGAAPKLGFGGLSVNPHCAHTPGLALGGWSARHKRWHSA
jgi:hypothetical protein